jgi:hypothetical protein
MAAREIVIGDVSLPLHVHQAFEPSSSITMSESYSEFQSPLWSIHHNILNFLEFINPELSRSFHVAPTFNPFGRIRSNISIFPEF